MAVEPTKRIREKNTIDDMKPLYNQEAMLIDGIFGMCLCFPSEGIDILEKEAIKLAHLTKDIDPRLQQIVLKVTALSEYYSVIESYLSLQHNGVTQQALCEGIVEFRECYVESICTLEKKARTELWTLQTIVCELQKEVGMLVPVTSILRTVTPLMSPKEIINVLYKKLTEFGGVQRCVDLIRQLIQRTCQPLMDFISTWMTKGELLYDEFFIRYEDGKHHLFSDEIPDCLTTYGSLAYKTGEYIRSILLYRSQQETERFQQMLQQQRTEMVEEQKTLPTIQLDSSLLFSFVKFRREIEKHAEIINSELFDVFQCCRIQETLQLIKQTYLFGEPSLYHNFFEVSHQLLSGIYSPHEELRLTYRLFDSLLYELKPIDLPATSLSVGFHPSLVKENVVEMREDNANDGYVFEAFVIKLVIPFPLSLIVDEAATLRYQILFQFLFQLQYHRYLMARAAVKVVQKRHPLVRQLKYAQLRFHLQLLITDATTTLDELMIFCVDDVIGKQWESFMTTEKYSVSDLFRLHSDFLNNALIQIGLNDKTIVDSYFALFKNIRDVLLSVYTIEKESGLEKQTDQEDIDSLDAMADDLLEALTRICSLLPNSSLAKRNACYEHLFSPVKTKRPEDDPFADIIEKDMK
ncbi:Spindle pole body component [Entamoeba marina]